MASPNTCVTRTMEGVIRGTNFTITGIDDATVGLVQQFQLQFQRKLSRIYDLASTGFYYIEGPSEGQVSFTKVVGPKGAPRVTCTCDPYDIILDAGPTLCQTQAVAGQETATGLTGTGNSAKYTLKNAMPFGLTGQGNSSNFLVIFGVSYMFNDIE